MSLADTPELFWLSLTIVLTGLFWVPYIAQLIVQLGPMKAIWDPYAAHPHDADWALRAKKAHYNAVENLVIMAPLILILHTLGLGTKQTALAAMIYFFARLGHYLVYTAAVPVVRTLLFLVGVGCQGVIAMRLFGLI